MGRITKILRVSMGNRSQVEKDILVTVAAWMFVNQTRDAKEIATALVTSERTIHRWAKTEYWENVLRSLKYEGERNFRVNPRRQ